MEDQEFSPEEIAKARADLERMANGGDEPETLTVERAPGNSPAGALPPPAGSAVSAQPPVVQEEAVEQEETPETPVQAPAAVAQEESPAETPVDTPAIEPQPETQAAVPAPPEPPAPVPLSSQAAQLAVKSAESSASRLRVNYDALTQKESAHNDRLAELAQKHESDGLSFAETREANQIESEIRAIADQKNAVAEQWLFTQAVIEDPDVAMKKEGFLKALRLGMLAKVMPDLTDSEEFASEKMAARKTVIEGMHRIVTGQTSPTAPIKPAGPAAPPKPPVRSVGPMHAGGAKAPAPSKPKARPAMSKEDEAELLAMGCSTLVSGLKGLQVNG